jgi:hypothetical protein
MSYRPAPHVNGILDVLKSLKRQLAIANRFLEQFRANQHMVKRIGR